MSYDALREADTLTVDSLVEEYGMADYTSGDESPEELQTELLEAINQFGSQTMDDTVKRRGMWALIRALGIIEAKHGLDTSFTDPEIADPNDIGLRHPELVTVSENGESYRSVLTTRVE